MIDADLKERRQALQDELTCIEVEMDERRRAREGEGWLCWPCTEKARAEGRIELTEHVYHEERACKQSSGDVESSR